MSDIRCLSLACILNKLPRSQAVAVFYFENHSVLNVRLITGSLLSSTGKTTFSPTPFPHAHSSPHSQAVGEFCAWMKFARMSPMGGDRGEGVLASEHAPYTSGFCSLSAHSSSLFAKTATRRQVCRGGLRG